VRTPALFRPGEKGQGRAIRSNSSKSPAAISAGFPLLSLAPHGRTETITVRIKRKQIHAGPKQGPALFSHFFTTKTFLLSKK
jgi:hypothetical protein